MKPNEALQQEAARRVISTLESQFDIPELANIEQKNLEANYVSSLGATSIEQKIKAGKRIARDMYPLTAPGMPGPGPDMIKLTEALGGVLEWEGKGAHKRLKTSDPVLEDIYREMLYSAGRVHIPISLDAHRTKRLAVVTGHRWFDQTVTGPIPTDVMIISKMLGEEEKHAGRNFVGASGELFQDMCDKLRIEGYEDWYVTNILKTEHPQAESGGSTLKVPWIKEFALLLAQELRLVRPKYILCVGADAVKAVLGKKATIQGMQGRVVELTYPIGRTEEDESTHTALVMACMHPAYVLRLPEVEVQLEQELARWGQLVQGFRPDKPELDIDHREIDTLQELMSLYKEINKTCHRNTISIDAEWHGQHPQNKGSYVRSVQLSWGPKKACCIHLTHPGGKRRFKGSRRQVNKWLKKICKGRRLVGQFLLADMEWFMHMGLDLRDEFAVPDNWEEYMENQLSDHPTGGFDTGLALHAIDETGDFGLTAQTLRFTSAPRYDTELTEWRNEYCNKRKLKREEMDGYGECPNEILGPYGNYDADVPSRLVEVYEKLLTSDRFGNCCWEPFWINMRATPAVLEMNTTGVLIDRERVDELSQTYMTSREKLARELQEWAKWPDLKLQSVFQIRELLFGEELNGKKRIDPHVPVRLRPKGARSMRINPCMTSGKRPMPWSEVVRKGEAHLKSPSTNKTSLAILSQDNTAVMRKGNQGNHIFVDYSPIIMKLRDYRFISQVLKSVLRDPATDDDDQFIMEDGFHTYSGGLPGRICDDGRVRTHISQVKETGRWSSWNPPLQNISKRREADYARILGELYKWPIRSIITSSPGYLLVEADFAGAELLGMALMSGDKLMIDHAMRASLPEMHPDYYDIHSNVTILAFHLPCEPTKSGLKSIGKGHLRIVAKSVIFGLAYGRGAKAIALALREEGVSVSVEEAQQIIDAILAMYPGLVPFFAMCRERAIKDKWICSCFGRYRRFSAARDRRVEGDIERQAMNFPIQNMVGDAASRACDYLYHYRERNPLVDYRILLQIHDALLLEVPYGHVEVVMKEVLPHCMSKCVPIYPTDLAGFWNGTGPYHLGVDVECCVAWGVSMKPNDYLKRSLNPELGHWNRQETGWTHPSKPGKIWVGNADGGQMLAV